MTGFGATVIPWLQHVDQELFRDPSGGPEFTPVFSGVRVARSFTMYCLNVDSLFVPLSLYCLSFFDLWLLVAHLEFSNFSFFLSPNA